jgi:hypothetical protein
LQRQVPFELHGFAPTPGSGIATIQTYDRPARWRRALLGLGRWWAIGLLCVLIPVAHLVLVPTFFLLGVVTFIQRIGTAERPTAARGTCPDCGTEQSMELAARWRTPQFVTCRQCHRGLTLTLPSARPSTL